jgi:hypothetical protein
MLKQIAVAAGVLALMGVSVCMWELGLRRLDSRYVLKADLDNVIAQANQVVQLHAAAIHQLQAKVNPPEDKKPE